MYNKIVNPETGRKVSIKSKLGKSIIQKYILYGGANCERLGDCEESEFCINNLCEQINKTDIKSGASKLVYLSKNSNLVYSETTTSSFKNNFQKLALIKESIIKEYMNSIFEKLYENIEDQYKSYIPYTPCVESLWINPIPEYEDRLYYYDTKFSEKNIFKKGYKYIMSPGDPDETNKIMNKWHGVGVDGTKMNHIALNKLWLKHANTTINDLKEIRKRLIIANYIMNKIGTIHSDIHSENVFYKNDSNRLCLIDWGKVRYSETSLEASINMNFQFNYLMFDKSFIKEDISSFNTTKIINAINKSFNTFKIALNKENMENYGYNKLKKKLIFPSGLEFFKGSHEEILNKAKDKKKEILDLLDNKRYEEIDILEFQLETIDKIYPNLNIYNDSNISESIAIQVLETSNKIKKEILDLLDNELYGEAEDLEMQLELLDKLYPNQQILKKSENNCNCISECDYKSMCDYIKGFCTNSKKCRVNTEIDSCESNSDYDLCV